MKTTKKKRAKRSQSGPIRSTAELADYLGLSIWTVSRAINGHPEVKTSTRERVIAAMNEVGFQPNPIARALNGKSTGVVGICFGNPRSQLMSSKVAILDEFLRSNGKRAILAITSRDVAHERKIIEDFRYLRVDGIIMVQSYLNFEEGSKLLRGIRAVHLDSADYRMTPNVSVDRHRAMRLLVDHLVSLGHRTFATLGFSSNNAWRWNGVVEALQIHGIDVKKNLHVFEFDDPGLESFTEGSKFAEQVLKMKNPPTALIGNNDNIALGAIHHIQGAGYSVPRDFSVTGFDNIEQSQFFTPTLTTIDQSTDTLISHAGNFLLRLLSLAPEETITESLKVEPILKVRNSSGPAP